MGQEYESKLPIKPRVHDGVEPAKSSGVNLAKGLRVRREIRVLRREKRDLGVLERVGLGFGVFEVEGGHVSVEEEEEEWESRSSR